MRIGHGYDSHRFADGGKKLVLGGVEFPGERGLLGHSDADVLIHAVIDALLGAAALGDIGSHFPDTSAEWKDADSTLLLKTVAGEISRAGYAVGNVDVTVVCESPRLLPKVPEIRGRLSSILGTDISAVSVKGKTNEKMDDVGSGIGIEAYAVCLLESKGGNDEK